MSYSNEEKAKFAARMAFIRGLQAGQKNCGEHKKYAKPRLLSTVPIPYHPRASAKPAEPDFDGMPEGRLIKSYKGKGAYYPRFAKAVIRAPIIYRRTPSSSYYANGMAYTGQGAYKKINGEKAGSTVGAYLGQGLGKWFGNLSGFGNYNAKIEGNTLIGSDGMKPAEIVNTVKRDSGIIIRHREYIQDIQGTVNFTNNTFSINPGLPTFAWVSQIAQAFEQFEFTALIFQYVSLSSDAVLSSATNSALGSIIMSTSYNVNNPVFTDKKTMLEYEFSNSGKPSISLDHPVECKRSETPTNNLYVRTTNITGQQDLRLYDLGTFQLATSGQQANGGVLGELHCIYEIKFFKPKLTSGIGLSVLTDHWKMSGTMNASNPFGTTSTLQVGSTIGTTLTPTTLTFPSFITDGSYMLIWQVFGTSTNNIAPAITVSSAVTSLSLWNNDTSNAITISATDGVAKTVYIVYTFKINGNGAVITFGTAGSLPVISSGDIWIQQFNGGISTFANEESVEEKFDEVQDEIDDLREKIRELKTESDNENMNCNNKAEIDKLEQQFIARMLLKMNSTK